MEERRRRSERNRVTKQAESSSVEKTMEPKTKYGEVVDCVYLNLRTSPNMSSPNNIIGTLIKGEFVQIHESVGDMLRVTTKVGVEGFIAAKYCKEV